MALPIESPENYLQEAANLVDFKRKPTQLEDIHVQPEARILNAFIATYIQLLTWQAQENESTFTSKAMTRDSLHTIEVTLSHLAERYAQDLGQADMHGTRRANKGARNITMTNDSSMHYSYLYYISDQSRAHPARSAINYSIVNLEENTADIKSPRQYQLEYGIKQFSQGKVIEGQNFQALFAPFLGFSAVWMGYTADNGEEIHGNLFYFSTEGELLSPEEVPNLVHLERRPFLGGTLHYKAA